jgi:hypothetical protein
MSSVTVKLGDIVSTLASIREVVASAQSPSGLSGNDLASLTQIGTQLLAVTVKSPITALGAALGAVAPIATGTTNISQGISSGNARQISDGILDVIAGAGGIMSSGLGGPVVAAAGIAISASATAVKMNRDSITDLLDPGAIDDLLERVRLSLFPEYRHTLVLVSALNADFRSATSPPRRDPLAIDLDGDGIETVGIPTNGSNPVLFDHDANGVKTGTGWLKGDDAWLVRDLNGNGSIESGRELFGVDTLITVTETAYGRYGPYQQTITRNARNGFEALSTLDDNRDGVFNASDAAFAQLQLWRDLNQDCISQAGELQSLAAAGITSIALTPTTTTTDLGNGNTITGTAAVQRTEVRHFGAVFGGFRSAPRCGSRTYVRSAEVHVVARLDM